MKLQGILDWFYARKAFVGSLFVAGVSVYNLVLDVLADESVSLTEAETVWTAVGGLLATLGVHLSIFQARNANATGSINVNRPDRGAVSVVTVLVVVLLVLLILFVARRT